MSAQIDLSRYLPTALTWQRLEIDKGSRTLPGGPRQIELMRRDELPETSALGRLRAKLDHTLSYFADLQSEEFSYSRLSSEQGRLKRAIEEATLKNTEPLQHAVNIAKLQLVERLLPKAEQERFSNNQIVDTVRNEFDREYARYAQLVRGVNERGGLADEATIREIRSLIEPRE